MQKLLKSNQTVGKAMLRNRRETLAGMIESRKRKNMQFAGLLVIALDCAPGQLHVLSSMCKFGAR
jgi:hypothetical protein